MDLGDVFDAVGSVLESMDGAGYDLPDGSGKPAEKRAIPLVEPEVNEFGRMTEWYHCGIRNTGSVCKCCGEYRRDRTVLDDPDSLKKATVPYWKCPECGINTVGEVCERCGQPRRTKISDEKPKPSLRKRIYYRFVGKPWAVLAAWLIFLMALVVLVLCLE